MRFAYIDIRERGDRAGEWGIWEEEMNIWIDTVLRYMLDDCWAMVRELGGGRIVASRQYDGRAG